MPDLPTLPNLPTYLAAETYDTILNRMLAAIKVQGIDVSEGSFAYDVCSAAALEVATLKSDLREALKRAFARYTFERYLDHVSEQRAGIFRTAAVKARTAVRFTGTNGTVIPAGTRVSTQLEPGATEAATEFATLAGATIPAGGSVDVLSECSAAGTRGNVAAGALRVLITPVAGVTGVTNPTAVGDGPNDVKGADQESDAALLGRYLQAVQNPPGSGSRSDYARWAAEVAGVGGVYVEPLGYGANTVRVVLVDSDKVPAGVALIQAVEDYLFAPHRLTREAEALTLGGSGVSIDATQGDDTGDSVKMVYNAGGAGTITDRLDLIPLPQPGIWRVFPRVKVDSTAGTADLLQVGVYTLTAGAWAKTTPTGATDALVTKRATDLTTAFGELGLDYYWNGQDQMELRITRLQTDTTTTVWVDQVRHQSTFQQDSADPKAPCTARIYVEPAEAVVINVSYHPVYAAGATPATVDAAVQANIGAYLRGLTLATDNDVRYVRIGSVILDTEGMLDYSNLLVNGGTANVAVAADQVAALGTITLT